VDFGLLVTATNQVLVYEANSDLHELMVEIVAATAA
jgi:hypothetical protein